MRNNTLYKYNHWLLLIIFTLLASNSNISAQKNKVAMAPQKIDTTRYVTFDTSEVPVIKERYEASGRNANWFIGTRMGVNMASMYFDNEGYSDYVQDNLFLPLVGIFAEAKVSNNFSFRPEFTYIGRGMQTSNIRYYQMKAEYVDFRVPLLFSLNFNAVQPYILAAPSFSLTTDNKIERDTLFVGVNSSDISKFDYGISLGGGLKFPIAIGRSLRFNLGVDAQYYIGLNNTFRTDEPGNIDIGKRKNRGLELAATLSFPIGGKVAVERTIEEFYVTKTERMEIRIRDTVRVTKTDTLISERVIQSTQQMCCCPIDEIFNMLENGLDICDRKICLNTIEFNFAKSDIMTKERKQIDSIATILKHPGFVNMTMEIYGHTDAADGIDHKYDNQKLSEDRANEVYNYLINQCKVNKNKISAVKGYGASRPIVICPPDEQTVPGECRPNRRVEFKIVCKD